MFDITSSLGQQVNESDIIRERNSTVIENKPKIQQQRRNSIGSNQKVLTWNDNLNIGQSKHHKSISFQTDFEKTSASNNICIKAELSFLMQELQQKMRQIEKHHISKQSLQYCQRCNFPILESPANKTQEKLKNLPQGIFSIYGQKTRSNMSIPSGSNHLLDQSDILKEKYCKQKFKSILAEVAELRANHKNLTEIIKNFHQKIIDDLNKIKNSDKPRFSIEVNNLLAEMHEKMKKIEQNYISSRDEGRQLQFKQSDRQQDQVSNMEVDITNLLSSKKSAEIKAIEQQSQHRRDNRLGSGPLTRDEQIIKRNLMRDFNRVTDQR